MPANGATGASQAGQPLASQLRVLPDWLTMNQAHPECPQVVGKFTCLALRVNGASHFSRPTGLLPADLQARYHTPSSTNGSGQVVAIVDAYDNPNITSDLATYRTRFRLGTANFTKYNQNGQTSNYPSGSTSWGSEEDLDVDMVSAICPKCTIYLIEANSNYTSDLETAEATAVNLRALIISNSWICYYVSKYCGASESSFSSPGVAYLAASGDFGYNFNGAPEWFGSVISVGGTQLTENGSHYSETVWNGAGGGCSSNGSSYGQTKPSWQHDPGCIFRTDSDVSSEAGCSPGVAEYDTYGNPGWFQECGTSAASPLNAGVIGLAGNASSLNAGEKFWKLKKKQLEKELHAITSGSDGSCGGSYLCQAGTKQFKTYSGPAGWGTPNGIKAY
jgi:subtilase family serine protease